jgi:hypothetical protein
VTRFVRRRPIDRGTVPGVAEQFLFGEAVAECPYSMVLLKFGIRKLFPDDFAPKDLQGVSLRHGVELFDLEALQKGCVGREHKAGFGRRVRDSGKRFRVIPVLLPRAERAERSSLPTFLAATTWVEFPGSLDDPAAFHLLVCGIRGLETGPGPSQALSEGQCPFRGLRVFDVDDAPFFFGREALVQWLLKGVRPATEGQPVNRFLAIVGASGSGKSSVARAGLVAALKHDAIPGSACWPVAIFRPGPDPLESKRPTNYRLGRRRTSTIRSWLPKRWA